MEPTNGVKTWQWVVTVIVIIVLIIIGILVFGSKSTETPITSEETPLENTTTPGALNRIVMSDQYPGNVVYLSSVQLAQPGFVVIQKDDNGKPGAVIGSMYFDKGINPGKVNLTESTVDGKTYYAVIYTDDGDKKFDATKDAPLKDSSGNVIMKVFRASSTASMELKG